jgi:hypothetical protein
MSRTALVDALRSLDGSRVRAILAANPTLEAIRNEKGLNLLQICCSRDTHGDPAAADRQLRLAKWLVRRGFDPRARHTTAPGEDGETEPADLSLVWFAVAKARNNRLARFFLEEGASPEAFFAAAWWSNSEILSDLVRHGGNINLVSGGTPVYMAVDVVGRALDGNPSPRNLRLKCLRTLLALGADRNIPSVERVTPLHLALRKEYPDAFELLLEYGADPEAGGKDGRSVREIAARKKDTTYAKALGALR